MAATGLSTPPARAAVAHDVGRLVVACPDGPGIVALITTFLHRNGADILQSDQFSTGERFMLRVEFHLEHAREGLHPLERRFAAEVAGPLGAEFRLRPSGTPTKVAIFVSRHDHCLLDLLWRARRGELPIEVVTVVSNHPDLEHDVAGFGVPYVHIPVTRETRAEAERAQLAAIAGRAELVVLARYMQILSGDFLRRAGVPVINIHHSFLPAFAGAGPYERAKQRGVKLVGATAHYATEDLDEGPIIEQDVVRVSHRLSSADLARRGADVERAVLARAVDWHCADRVFVDGRTTVVF
ncbi:formyltetrahydrofolate deformylase [Herbidospora yilanensis]|uniref:formyltetrahydrofolate deformylase n=1 Tax=Herbidospora yilanensis TaxID=354426 RepID=UPI0007816B8F|nr:formyltetrahydrofolate deformylase [Herbidospora yilanensis]